MISKVFILAIFFMLTGACAHNSRNSQKMYERSEQFLIDVPIVEIMERGLASDCKRENSDNWRELAKWASSCAAAEEWAEVSRIAYHLKRVSPENPWGSYFLSVAALNEGNLRRSQWMIEEAIEQAGGRYGLFFYQRGLVHLRSGDQGMAVSDFKLALEREERLFDVALYLGELYLLQGNMDLSERYFKKVPLKKRSNSRYQKGLGINWIQRSNTSKKKAGCELLLEYLQGNPGDANLWTAVIDTYELDLQSPEEAMQALVLLQRVQIQGGLDDELNFDVNDRIESLRLRLETESVNTAQSEGAF